MNRFMGKSFILFLLVASLSGATYLSRKQDVSSGLGATAGAICLEPGASFGQNLHGSSNLRQYTVAGHVLGFREDGVVIASGSHALRVEFVNARPISPVEEGTPSGLANGQGRTPALGKVTYSDLWDGVSVIYEKTESGVVKSTYQVRAGGAAASHPVDEIRLRYNVPVRVDESGNLLLTLAAGEMRETRPVAWQEIGRERAPVEVGYRLMGEREVGFRAGTYDTRYDLVIDPTLSWHTFLGSSDYDWGKGIAADTSGNVYVIGYSNMSWGAPIRPFTDGDYWTDAFVAKLGADGILQWNTFLGGTWEDRGEGIALDAAGNCYVTGWSTASWGTPVRPFTSGDYSADAFVAKLDTNGALQWNTFLGGTDNEEGSGIAVDASGNSYALGIAEGTWGSPVRPFAYGGEFIGDAYVAKLNTNGALQWNTFLGGIFDDNAYGIAADTSGNVFVTGDSETTWGNPIDPFVGDEDNEDAFVAKLASNGALLWNTFIGAAVGDDCGNGIAVDTSGNVYVAGESDYGWGSPVRPFADGDDAFVAKFNTNGARQWHSFLGWSGYDEGFGIAVDTSGCVYMVGTSEGTWGSPIRPFAGGGDAFLAKVDANGLLQWNTFLGGSDSAYDFGYGIALDASGNCHVIGTSDGTWGTPLNPFAGYPDAFIAKIGNGIRVDFNQDGQEDILWRYYGTGGYNRAWFLGNTGGSGLPLSAADPQMSAGQAVGRFAGIKTVGGTTSSPRAMGMNPGRGRKTPLRMPRNLMGDISGRLAGLAAVHDPRLAGTGDFKPSLLRIADPRDLKLALNPVSASNAPVEIAATPLLLGGADVMPVGDLNWQIMGTGDFNNDTHVDILWRFNGAGGTNVVWFMEGTNWTGSAELLPVGDLNWQIVGTGDFNNDTHVDILWRNSSSGSNVVWYMNGVTWMGSAVLLGVSDPTWQIVGTGDFNNDTHVDILWRYNGAGGYNVVWYMNGANWTGSAELIPVGDSTWQIMGTGDYNADGNIDILWRYNGPGGYNYIWYMNGVNWTGSAELLSVPDLNWNIVSR